MMELELICTALITFCDVEITVHNGANSLTQTSAISLQQLCENGSDPNILALNIRSSSVVSAAFSFIRVPRFRMKAEQKSVSGTLNQCLLNVDQIQFRFFTIVPSTRSQISEGINFFSSSGNFWYFTEIYDEKSVNKLVRDDKKIAATGFTREQHSHTSY